MRKLTLALDDLRVDTFETEAAAAEAGTVFGNQTQPDSTFNPCTGTHCTYPVHLCRPAKDDNPGEKKQPG
jgi:hypothetical protein